MRDPRHTHATASPLPEPVGAPADDIAEVVSLDLWRQRASAATASPQALAGARAAHPARLWADRQAAPPRAATPS
jgi:hypothetical protein